MMTLFFAKANDQNDETYMAIISSDDNSRAFRLARDWWQSKGIDVSGLKICEVRPGQGDAVLEWGKDIVQVFEPKRVNKLCGQCREPSILVSSSAYWDYEGQNWEIADILEGVTCQHCGETYIASS